MSQPPLPNFQAVTTVPEDERRLQALEARINELNHKATQLLTFLSFALVVAAILQTSSGSRLGICQTMSVTFAMRCWVVAIFPILIGILPVKEIRQGTVSWYRVVRYSKALLLCAAMLLIAIGTLFFLCAIWNAPASASGTWSYLPGEKTRAATFEPMYGLWKHAPTPGVLTVVLALFAAVISIPPLNKWLEKKRSLRSLCICVFFLLAAGEILIIRHAEQVTIAERKDENENHLEELRKQDSKFEQEMAFLIDFKESVQSGLANVNARITKEKSQPNPDSLKIETLQLTKDVLQFLSDRERLRPYPSSSKDYRTASEQWGNDTLAGYISQFGQRIISLSEKYQKRGLDPGTIEVMCLRPVNPLMIPVCATEIQALTGKLPN